MFFPTPADPCPGRRLSGNPLWNLSLLTVGSGLLALGVQGVAAHYGFLTGGVLGLSLLMEYLTGLGSAPSWNLLLNLPLLLFGWFKVSRRFVLYSLYGTTAIYVWGQIMGSLWIPVQTPLYAAIVAGVLVGAGTGIMLRSLGSSGGTDLVGVYLFRRWNIPVGRFTLMFNVLLFLGSAWSIEPDLIMVSLITVFISAQTTDYVVRLFSQYKMVFIITARGKEIREAIIAGQVRATIIPAWGGFTHEPRDLVMTVTSTFFLRYLEDTVFAIDPKALFAVENTFYVSGAQYPRRTE